MEDRNNNQLEVLNHLSKGNKFVFYVYRKVSKVSTAVYLVTDLIKDAEPLKWSLRKVATDVVSFRNFFDEKSVFNNVEIGLLELEGLVELARVSKVVSEMNCFILLSEIRKIVSEMKERSKEGYFAPELVSSYFDVLKPAVVTLEELIQKQKQEKQEVLYKGHKGQGTVNDFYTAPKAPVGKAPLIDREEGVDSKGQRRDEIVKITKEKGTVTIKDITDQIKDCSEKTIQRELIAMVDQGLLKKTGERRWSRYTVA